MTRPAIVLIILCLTWPTPGQTTRPATRPHTQPATTQPIRRTPLLKAPVTLQLPPEAQVISWQATEDGRGYALALMTGQKIKVCHNNVIVGLYDDLKMLTLSPDGTRLAFAAAIDGRWHMVIDGQPGTPFHDALEGLDLSICFSPDSEHVAGILGIEGKWHVLLDANMLSDEYLIVRFMQFNQHNQLVVAGKNPLRYHLKIGDRQAGPYEFMSGFQFNHRGRLTARARRAAQWFALVDTTPGRPWDMVEQVTVSPDSKYRAVAVRRGPGKCVAINGQPGHFHQQIGTLRWTADHQLWYPVQEANHYTLQHLDPATDQPAQSIDLPAGRIDLNQWAISDDGANRLFFAHTATGVQAVYNGKPTRSFAALSDPVVQGARWACITQDRHQQRMLVDGQLGPKFDQLNPPVFSPDGRHVAYTGIDKNHYWLVIDQQVYGPYLQIQPIQPQFQTGKKTLDLTICHEQQLRHLQLPLHTGPAADIPPQ